MKLSIKTYLLVNLLLSVIIVSVLATFINLALKNHLANQRLDNKLQQTTTKINQYLSKHNSLSTFDHTTDTHLKQIIKNNMLAKASYNKNTILAATNDSLIMLISLPFLAIIIWIIVSRGLAPLNRAATEISNRAPTQLTPVDLDKIPAEIKPLIQELNDLFERLAETLEREKRFASDAAHELRTPLAILSTQTQIAIRAKTDEDRYEALAKIVSGVRRSGHIIHQLLTLSRMVPQASVEAPVIFNLGEPALEMVAELVPQALTKEIEIELDAPEPTYIKGNSVAISILLRNLIDNAMRYSPEEGLVIVSTRNLTEQNKVQLIVRDTGPGIPEELRERVFERFFRALGNKAAGSGLGLGIVKQIVKLHRGKITLRTPQDPENDPKANKGLEIVIEFPAQPAPTADAGPTQPK